MTPIRTCLGCQKKLPQPALRRFWLDAQGSPRLEAQPGRSGYWCGAADCLPRVCQPRRLERALRRPCDPEALRRLLEGAPQP